MAFEIMTTAQAVSFAYLHQTQWSEVVRNGAIVCTVLSAPFIFVLGRGGRETARSVSDAFVVLGCSSCWLHDDLWLTACAFPQAALCFAKPRGDYPPR